MFIVNSVGQSDCRYVKVPACEPDLPTTNIATQPLDALALFQMRQRDTIDFTVDFTEWLAANGSPALTAATAVTAAGSPKTPHIDSTVFASAGKVVFVLSPPPGTAPGDTYYIDLTVNMSATTPEQASDVAIPARTLVRRIHVIVVAG